MIIICCLRPQVWWHAKWKCKARPFQSCGRQKRTR